MADEQATDVVDREESQNGTDDGGRSRLAGLTSKEILLPAAATAAAAAMAGLAAKKGPDLMKMLGGEADEEAEKLGRKGAQGAKSQLASGGGIAGKAASKLLGGGGGGAPSGGKTRRLPIQRWTDVAVPVEKAFKTWTQFEEFPKFMHRVLDVDPEEDNKIHWREKIWFSTREWDGEITDKRQNDRIAWKSVSGTQHSGVISFHRLDKNLTRVLVTVDFVPSGMIEKMASGMRFVKRAVEADLARFKAYVEFGDAKGLEYRSQPEEMEQHRDGDDEAGEGDAQSRGESGGDKKDSSEDENRDRDSERRERENRRHERREALTSS
ncbi:MAG: SRPBCC family protein [Actinobacteria bacterium]|nr:MAG: SRPBCC family protein [Actinomycetota bacterium]